MTKKFPVPKKVASHDNVNSCGGDWWEGQKLKRPKA